MSKAETKSTTSRGHAPKGSKAALEAAGWQFTPLPRINRPGSGLPRRDGERGVTAIPPAGSGIEPKQHEGSGRAIAWAVEQSAMAASNPPIGAVSGMSGLRLMLGMALASGKVCAGPDDVPVRPDGELLSICNDALSAAEKETKLREGKLGDGRDPRFQMLLVSMDAQFKALAALPKLHATTRDGLLQKARAARLAFFQTRLPGGLKDELVASVLEDLIHLVPTLIDEQGRAVPPVSDAGGECVA